MGNRGGQCVFHRCSSLVSQLMLCNCQLRMDCSAVWLDCKCHPSAACTCRDAEVLSVWAAIINKLRGLMEEQVCGMGASCLAAAAVPPVVCVPGTHTSGRLGHLVVLCYQVLKSISCCGF